MGKLYKIKLDVNYEFPNIKEIYKLDNEKANSKLKEPYYEQDFNKYIGGLEESIEFQKEIGTYRVDSRLELDDKVIIIECDEDSHIRYKKNDEIIRMRKLQKLESKPLSIIRFNPTLSSEETYKELKEVFEEEKVKEINKEELNISYINYNKKREEELKSIIENKEFVENKYYMSYLRNRDFIDSLLEYTNHYNPIKRGSKTSKGTILTSGDVLYELEDRLIVIDLSDHRTIVDGKKRKYLFHFRKGYYLGLNEKKTIIWININLEDHKILKIISTLESRLENLLKLLEKLRTISLPITLYTMMLYYPERWKQKILNGISSNKLEYEVINI